MKLIPCGRMETKRTATDPHKSNHLYPPIPSSNPPGPPRHNTTRLRTLLVHNQDHHPCNHVTLDHHSDRMKGMTHCYYSLVLVCELFSNNLFRKRRKIMPPLYCVSRVQCGDRIVVFGCYKSEKKGKLGWKMWPSIMEH